MAIDLTTCQLDPFPSPDRLDLLALNGRLWHTYDVNPHSRPAIHDNLLIMGGSDGVLVARDLHTGDLAWIQKLGAPISTPLVHDAVVYICAEGCLHAVDAESGLIAWTARSTAAGFTDPAICDDVLYISGRDGQVLAIEPSTGDLFWQAQASGRVEIAPIVADELVIVRTETGELEAMDILTGEHRWRSSAGWSFDPAQMVVVDHSLITTGPGGTLIAMDTETGAQHWEADIAGISGGLLCIDEQVVAAGTLPNRSTELVAFNAEHGARTWSHIIPDGVSSDLQMYGAMLLVGDRAGTVHAIDCTAGTARWVLPVDETMAISAVLGLEDTLLVGMIPLAGLATLHPELPSRSDNGRYRTPSHLN